VLLKIIHYAKFAGASRMSKQAIIFNYSKLSIEINSSPRASFVGTATIGRRKLARLAARFGDNLNKAARGNSRLAIAEPH
jgi:hypothetical protein